MLLHTVSGYEDAALVASSILSLLRVLATGDFLHDEDREKAYHLLQHARQFVSDSSGSQDKLVSMLASLETES